MISEQARVLTFSVKLFSTSLLNSSTKDASGPFLVSTVTTWRQATQLGSHDYDDTAVLKGPQCNIGGKRTV